MSRYDFNNDASDDDDGLRCENCGATNCWIRDAGTDILTCQECYTQSQSQSQRMVEDEADAFGSGNLAKSVLKVTNSTVKSSTRSKTNEDLDESISLPTTLECCEAFQRLLQLAAEDAIVLAGICDIENKSEMSQAKTLMISTVEKIWFSYLQSWNESAALCSKAFPEVRFSFRDEFLSKPYRSLVKNYLIAAGEKDHKTAFSSQEDKQNEQSKSRKRQKRTHEHFSPMNQQSIDRGLPNKDQVYYRPSTKSIKEMLKYTCQGSETKVPQYFAALGLKPDSTLLTSIIYLALMMLKTGVASHHLHLWASDGTFKYTLNGFDYIPSELKGRLFPVRSNFKLHFAPSPAMLDYTADMLFIACDPLQIMSPFLNDEEREHFSRQSIDDLSRTLPFKLFQDNLPMLTYRLVLDLGVSRRVFELAMALMGLSPGNTVEKESSTSRTKMKKERALLPSSLDGALPKNLISVLHVMSVVVVACRMCDGWEDWSVMLSMKVAEKDNQNVLRFIPWNDENGCFVGNGKMLNDYYDFVDDIYGSDMKDQESYINFFPTLKGNLKNCDGDDYDVKGLDAQVVLPSTTIAGARNPNMAPTAVNRKNANFWRMMRYRHRAAICAEANGIGKYVFYKDKEHEANLRSTIFRPRKDLKQTPAPFHPHYALLIEYAADKLGAEPNELHSLVASLDQELFTIAS